MSKSVLYDVQWIRNYKKSVDHVHNDTLVQPFQSIVGSTFFELMVKYDNVNDPQPKPPPNPEFVRKYERAKERWRAQGWKPSYKKPTKIRPDEEFM